MQANSFAPAAYGYFGLGAQLQTYYQHQEARKGRVVRAHQPFRKAQKASNHPGARLFRFSSGYWLSEVDTLRNLFLTPATEMLGFIQQLRDAI
ncbi:MAG: hypothetical protein AABN95_08395 [Acidobacteriota bacterium]